ncbi:MAG: HIT family protein [Anaerolineae bacterium]|nr:HIT family protein [Anaerolineae bacterium]MDW8102745.1 HIT family protein [Anaerolineae bacterium]
MRDCVFCRIVRREAPAEIVYEDEKAMAFMDINPVTPGHTLLIPKAHFRNIFDLDEEVASHLMKVAVKLAPILREAMEADGLNILNANEPAAFQSVFHFHLHLVPRTFGDGIMPPWIQKPGNPAQIRAAAERIRKVVEAKKVWSGKGD